ncbi:MAG: putative cytochrome c [Candidatus Scalindua rubra]|uniref:Putative cytochrome c n=1 Tax=Candidatus Scalindua rubra TaxID=1872076 RepID=A0A1E3XDI3_9BACT|nr:MAG: putative cytochrome c [Candidatus Scalindua rubra]
MRQLVLNREDGTKNQNEYMMQQSIIKLKPMFIKKNYLCLYFIISGIVILLTLSLQSEFFYLYAQEELTIRETEENIKAGKTIYMKKCQYCHGIDGDGEGPAAPFLDPPPRDLTRARYKIISTEVGELPTDQDIFNVISNGIPDTSMPGWSSLSKKEIWQVVHYIKKFAERFDWYKEIKKVSKIVEIDVPQPATEESIERGRQIYMKKLECWKCHGEGGRGDGPSAPELLDEWEFPIKPTNLTKPWKFKIGSSERDIYRAIITGTAGTPMPAFIRGNTKKELWDLTNYVKSLGPKKRPQRTTVLKSKFISDNLPKDVNDPLWNSTEAVEFPLFGQILEEPRMYTPSVDEIYVKSIYNNNEIVFLIEWDDNTQSKHGTTKDGEAVYADSLAIQFPVKIPESPVSPRPFFMMGDLSSFVNLWLWESDPNVFKELNAWGIKKKKDQSEESKDIEGKAVYEQGQYKLLIKRNLTTSDKKDDIQIEVNKFIPISFLVWDGNNGETENMMAISSWYYLFLEKKETGVNILYSALALFFTVIVEIIFMKGIRRRAQYKSTSIMT